jgi:fatty-acyl-CoA synthase
MSGEGGRKRVPRISKEASPYRTELTPVSFLRRSAYVYPDRTAVVHGDRRYTYRRVRSAVQSPRSALRGLGLGKLDRVAIIAPNTPAMLEATTASRSPGSSSFPSTRG